MQDLQSAIFAPAVNDHQFVRFARLGCDTSQQLFDAGRFIPDRDYQRYFNLRCIIGWLRLLFLWIDTDRACG